MSDGLLDDQKQTDVLEYSGKTKKKDHFLKSSHSTDKTRSPLKSFLGLKKKKSKNKDKDDFDLDDFPDTGKSVEAGKESEEWNAFKEMQDRISANLQKTQQNLSKLEKTLSEGGSEVNVPGPSADWERFEEANIEEESEENKIEEAGLTTSKLPAKTHSTATQDCSARPDVVKDSKAKNIVAIDGAGLERNKPRATHEKKIAPVAPVTNGATCDLLGLDTVDVLTKSAEMSAIDDLLGLDTIASPSSADHPDSGLSSGVVSPTPNNGAADPFGLTSASNDGDPSVSNSIVDDFLGLSSQTTFTPTKISKSPIPPAKTSAPTTPKAKPARPPPPKITKGMSKDLFNVSTDDSYDPFGPTKAKVGNDSALTSRKVETNGVGSSLTNTNTGDDDLFKVPEISEVLQSTVITKDADGATKIQLKQDVAAQIAATSPAKTNPFTSTQDSEKNIGMNFFGNNEQSSSCVEPCKLPIASVAVYAPSEHSSQEDDGFDPRGRLGDSFDATPVSGDVDLWSAAPEPQKGDEPDFFVAFPEPGENKVIHLVDETANEPNFFKAFPDPGEDQVIQLVDPAADFDNTDGATKSNDNEDPLYIFATTMPSNNTAAVIFPDDLFGDTASDAFFTQVQEESVSRNPFADDQPSITTSNPFADTDEAIVTNDTDPPDFDAIFGAEDLASAFKSHGGRSGSEGQIGLGVFDPFQTIYPTSSDEHAHGLGTISDDEDEKAMVVRISDAKTAHDTSTPAPLLPPPPKHDNPPRFNPFNDDSSPEISDFPSFPKAENNELCQKEEGAEEPTVRLPPVRTESEEREDEEMRLPPVSDDFHPLFDGDGWSMMIRQPQKKRLTQNRYWKQCYVRLIKHETGFSLKIFENEENKEPFQELNLQPCYALDDEELQQYDAFGKIHTVKITYVFYKERVGVRAERLTPQNIQNLIRKPRTTMLLDHAPQVSEVMKLGSLHQDVMKSFIWEVENTMMRLIAYRDKTLTYVKDEVSMEVWDEYDNELDTAGHIAWQKARVRCFCLTFISGMPTLELGINDLRRKGREIVGRHDIIPVRTEEWIRLQLPEFHTCVEMEEFEKTNMIRFRPLDASQFELFRFRISLRPNQELPLQCRIQQNINKRRIELRADVLIPGYYSSSTKDGQIPCEDIQIRFPIPECWIYLFRVEKRFGYGSVKSTTRKPGRIKGLERITMMAQGFAPPSLIEVGVGSAKYEHIYRSIVWRIPRLPERHHGAYKTHLFLCRLDLGPHDEIPDVYEKYAHVQFNMPGSTMSRTAIRSISADTCEPPEKWVRYIAKFRYKVEIDHTVEANESDEPISLYKPELKPDLEPEPEHEPDADADDSSDDD